MIPIKRAKECLVHLLGHFITLGGALVRLGYRLLTKDILASSGTNREVGKISTKEY